MFLPRYSIGAYVVALIAIFSSREVFADVWRVDGNSFTSAYFNESYGTKIYYNAAMVRSSDSFVLGYAIAIGGYITSQGVPLTVTSNFNAQEQNVPFDVVVYCGPTFSPPAIRWFHSYNKTTTPTGTNTTGGYASWNGGTIRVNGSGQPVDSQGNPTSANEYLVQSPSYTNTSGVNEQIRVTIRDAQGNILSTYNQTAFPGVPLTVTAQLDGPGSLSLDKVALMGGDILGSTFTPISTTQAVGANSGVTPGLGTPGGGTIVGSSPPTTAPPVSPPVSQPNVTRPGTSEGNADARNSELRGEIQRGVSEANRIGNQAHQDSQNMQGLLDKILQKGTGGSGGSGGGDVSDAGTHSKLDTLIDGPSGTAPSSEDAASGQSIGDKVRNAWSGAKAHMTTIAGKLSGTVASTAPLEWPVNLPVVGPVNVSLEQYASTFSAVRSALLALVAVTGVVVASRIVRGVFVDE